MSRVRPRRYRNVDVVNFGRHEHLRARSKIKLLKGQSFGRAGEGRILSPDERREVEEKMRREGLLP
jgi:hypothetical protein